MASECDVLRCTGYLTRYWELYNWREAGGTEIMREPGGIGVMSRSITNKWREAGGVGVMSRFMTIERRESGGFGVKARLMANEWREADGD